MLNYSLTLDFLICKIKEREIFYQKSIVFTLFLFICILILWYYTKYILILVLQAFCETKQKMILLPNVFKFLVLDIRIDRSIRMTATTKYPLNSRSCWRRHTSVFLCCLITRNLAGIYTQSALKIEKKTSKGFEQ